MQKLISSYTEKSTIAGLHYAFEPKQSLIGRTLWIVSIGILTCLGVYLSVQNYVQWMEEPVLTTITTTGNNNLNKVLIFFRVFIFLLVIGSLHSYNTQGEDQCTTERSSGLVLINDETCWNLLNWILFRFASFERSISFSCDLLSRFWRRRHLSDHFFAFVLFPQHNVSTDVQQNPDCIGENSAATILF